ncbi:MAG: methyltransferase family protein [Elusimicrobiota bacterium]
MSRFSERGGWWVVAQFIPLSLIVASPAGRTTSPAAPFLHRLGEILLTGSAGVLTAGCLKLGRRLTPFPRPRDDSSLVTDGVYRYVRHPLYLGVILAALLNAKASREEAWLSAKFPDYASYRLKSRKLIPFLY